MKNVKGLVGQPTESDLTDQFSLNIMEAETLHQICSINNSLTGIRTETH